jgi:hypothetical protein
MKTVKTTLGELPVNYGHFALSQFSEMRNIPMDEVFELDLKKLNYGDIMAFLYVGVKDGARKAGEDCKVKNLEEFCDLADENPNIASDIFDIFAKYRKDKGEESSEDPDKKK